MADQTNSLSPSGRLEQIRSGLKELSFARDALPANGSPEAFEFFLRKLEASKHSTTALVKACQMLHQPNTDFERRKFPLLSDITRIAFDLDQSTAQPAEKGSGCVKCHGGGMVVLTPDGRAYGELSLADMREELNADGSLKREAVATAGYPCPMCRNEAAMKFYAVRRWFAWGMPEVDPAKAEFSYAVWERLKAGSHAKDDDPRRKRDYYEDSERF